ncbi:MAG: cell division protein FtsB [Halorhodospira halophila]|uniref:cell division protein FtsB n=1 Tax=Halorhodospira TaxID=85108 RepID=UPI00191138EF|nr:MULTISPECIES: cell division protein FtsB [Halorhodospira]MBK5937011.1 cell division protein FtsB [Halorhodospira halophila]MBK5943755.1 cell division protein FtsB [Halorhodospira halophila]MCC3750286.1 cell division protein FtsB [Halorhodospira halophila]MCG5528384.1 cell division protein FtsB [Halorhodospira halophila]MCG5532178.1 cell division protein FtsB [Halorhodospira sp. 9621]
MRWVNGLLGVLLILLQGQLWFGQASIPGLLELRSAVAAQQAENERAEARNEALAAEVENLKESTEALEERARYELGMIRQDEVFYQVVEE